MRKADLFTLALLLVARPVPAADRASVDSPAPQFTLTDGQGVSHSLADYRGKYVILEWVNFGCPFVGKHYGSGSMQELQRTMTGRGTVWLSICSSAPGKQGFYEGEELKEKLKQENASPTAYLVDADGAVGKLYGAKTTPHMFIVDPQGVLIYEGGIDNIASTDRADIAKATNYVKEVMAAAWDGKPLPVKTTRSYGCSVKYK
ncbi:MAG TPA: redoxin domain-containing protein [Bacteroidota bacterium]